MFMIWSRVPLSFLKSLTECLLIVAHHSLVDNVQYYVAGDKCNSSIAIAVHLFPFLVGKHIDGSFLSHMYKLWNYILGFHVRIY